MWEVEVVFWLNGCGGHGGGRSRKIDVFNRFTLLRGKGNISMWRVVEVFFHLTLEWGVLFKVHWTFEWWILVDERKRLRLSSEGWLRGILINRAFVLKALLFVLKDAASLSEVWDEEDVVWLVCGEVMPRALRIGIECIAHLDLFECLRSLLL